MKPRQSSRAPTSPSERQLAAIYDNVPGVVFYLRVEAEEVREGVLTYRFVSVNRAFYTVTGLTEAAVIGKLVSEVIPEPSLAIVLERYREAVALRETVRWEELSEYPAGNRYGEVAVTPLFDDDGYVTHIIGIVNDITARRIAEQHTRDEQARLAGIIGSAMDAIITIDDNSRVVLFNGAAQAMFGYLPSEILDQPIERLIPARFRAAHTDHIASFARTGVTSRAMGVLGTIFGARKDGSEFPVEASISQVEVCGSRSFTVILRDVTERKVAEERINKALREKEVLLKEIHHRVKNNLQIVASLLYLQGRTTDIVGAAELLAESANRVRSMALVHELLYRSDDLARISLRTYLNQLAEQLMTMHRPRSLSVPLQLGVIDATVDIKTAIPCGMIINELVSNAYKHGFPSGASGRIDLEVTQLSTGGLRIAVIDDGVGAPPGFAIEDNLTLGMQIVVMLTLQLEGTVTHRRETGRTRFELEFTPEVGA